MGVRNYLIEGVSCAGKTTVCDELIRRGHHAVHGDRDLAYQGDPVTGEGILCFQHFGWQILRDLEAAGFQSAYALAYDEVEYGYYTQDPILIFRAVA